MTKAQKQEREEAKARLREWIRPGDTLFTVLRHRSSSGMMRTIQVVKLSPRWRCNGCGRTLEDMSAGPTALEHSEYCEGPDVRCEVEPWHLGYNAAKALGWRYDTEREGIKVGGCGMDMGFHLVYELSSVLFRGEDGTPHDAGYTLHQRWL